MRNTNTTTLVEVVVVEAVSKLIKLMIYLRVVTLFISSLHSNVIISFDFDD